MLFRSPGINSAPVITKVKISLPDVWSEPVKTRPSPDLLNALAEPIFTLGVGRGTPYALRGSAGNAVITP